MSLQQPLVVTGSNAPADRRWEASLRLKSWTRFAGPIASLAILAAAAYQLHDLAIAQILALVPASPMFWIAFALNYLAAPIAEWFIYRRLWRLPPGGFSALLRKLLSNEMLVGYLGEVYFYAWARQHARITAAPFGAIKDVAILSAVAGNISALLLTFAVYPIAGELNLGLGRATWLGSIAIVLGSSLVIMLLRRRVFSLPRDDLRFVFNAHVARIVATTALTALTWHVLLPGVALSMWLLLIAIRQLISRLPLVPSKDVVFAGIATFVIGAQSEIVAAMTLMAALILATHVMVGLLLGLRGLMDEVAR